MKNLATLATLTKKIVGKVLKKQEKILNKNKVLFNLWWEKLLVSKKCAIFPRCWPKKRPDGGS